jgi:hypothetical protein
MEKVSFIFLREFCKTTRHGVKFDVALTQCVETRSGRPFWGRSSLPGILFSRLNSSTLPIMGRYLVIL